jgi:hypothetical protein
MIDGRLSFGDGDAAPFCSHVLVFGDTPEDALDVLDRRGVVFSASEKIERSEQQDLTSAVGSGPTHPDHTGGFADAE